MITRETIDKIIDAARVEEVVGEFVTLKKRGANYIGLCPFHDEKTPSFSVSAAKGIYKCFGCGKGGNAVNFVMDHEHYSYPEALKFLAKKYSIEIEETAPDPQEQQALDEKESLFNITAFAQKFFSDTLHETEEGKAIGLTYFKERGYTTETINKFGLGYSPDKYDEFTKHAMKNGYQRSILLETSLSKTRDGTVYDSFRGRVIFPIHNLSGRVLGFGARIITSDKKKPKYLNSAESDIYQKSKVLYGLYFSKTAIIKEDNCFLVEGYTDVISLHQAGVENVISTSGTSLTTEQIRLIRRYTKNVTLLFDADAAGIKAAFRGIDMILEEGMNVRVITFPEGEDPDSYAQKYRPAEVKEFLESKADDFITFKTKLLYKETKDDPIKKAGLIKEIANTISLIPDPIIRTLYVQKCAAMVNIEENILFMEINKLRRNRSKEEAKKVIADDPSEEIVGRLDSEEQLKSVQSCEHQERELLRVMLQFGLSYMSFEFEDEDGEKQTQNIRIVDFITDDIINDNIKLESPQLQKLFDIIVDLKNKDEFNGEQSCLHHENDEIRKLSIDILSTPYSLSDNWRARHDIYVKTEEDDLQKNVLNTLYSFKLKKLDVIIGKNLEKLKELEDIEDIIKCQEMDINLKKARTIIAKELSRVITH